MVKLYLLPLLIFLFLIPSVSSYEVIDNSVVEDNENVYFSITPHTLNKSGWVDIKLKSKGYTGNIDVLFGFDSQDAIPQSIERYNPHWTYKQRSYTCDYEFNYTTSPKFFTCFNITHVNVGTNATPVWEDRQVIYREGEFDSGNLQEKIVYWDIGKFNLYSDMGTVFKEVDKNFDGKDTWYLGKNLNVNAGQEYNVRVYISIFPNSVGKYDIAIKRSSQTLQQAIDTETLYFIDPWWEITYENRTEILNSSELSINIPYSVNDNLTVDGIALWTRFNVTCSGIQYVYNDTDSANTFAIANDTTECVWENSSDLTGNNPTGVYPSDQSLMMHYDDGTNVQDSTSNNNDGTSQNTPTSVTGKIGNALSFTTGDADGVNITGSLLSTTNATQPHSVCAWINADVRTDNQIVAQYSGGANRHTFRIVSNKLQWWKASSGTYDSSADVAAGTWTHVCWTKNETGYIKLFINTGEDGGGADANAFESINTTIGHAAASGVPSFDGEIDEVMIFDRELSLSEIQQLYWNGIDNLTSFSSTIETSEIIINSPENISYSVDALPTSVELNVSHRETVDNWWYQYNSNGTNISFTPNTTVYAGGLGGVKRLDVWANVSNVEYSKTIYFTTNTIPVITSVTPATGTTTTESTIILNATITDPDIRELSYHYFNESASLDSNLVGAYTWTINTLLDGNTTWEVRVSDGYTNSTFSNQTLNFLIPPDDCTDGRNDNKVVTLNMTNEKNLSDYIHGAITVIMRITHNGSTYDFSTENNGSATGIDICADDVFIGDEFDADITYHNEPNFETSNWYIRSLTLSATTSYSNISLLNSSDASSILFTVFDGLRNLAPQHIVRAQRFDTDTSSWEIMRMGRTSFNGQTLMPLEAFDAFYQFVVTDDNGIVLKEFEEFTISRTEETLQLNPEIRGYYPEVSGDISTICTYNDVTFALVCTVTDASATIGGANLIVDRAGALSWSRWCTDYGNGSSVTLSCTLNGNDVFWYMVTAHFDDNLAVSSGQINEFAQENTYGQTGFIAGAFLTLATGLVGLYSAPAAPIFLFLGFAMANFLDLIELQNTVNWVLLATLVIIVVWRTRE